MNSKRIKGHNGEREIAMLINAALGIDDAKRNLEQSREGGGDINLPGIVIEVKRHETLNIKGWWRQVQRAADQCGDLPILAFRQNRRPWRFIFPAILLVPGVDGTLETDEKVFIQFLKVWLYGHKKV